MHHHRFDRSLFLAVSLLLFGTTYADDRAPITLSISLVASNYHGYNISCNGAQDGWIDLTITGGVAPFLIDWSNKATTEDISGLAAGYYHVTVAGANGERVEEEITLTQPLALSGEISKSLYANGHNISCFECANGYINPVVHNGVAPLTYSWQDGPTTLSRSNLGPGEYKLKVEDANHCKYEPTTTLTEPPRSDWTMSGNAGTTPGTQYIGTSDNKDVVFKSNGTERLRLKANGDFKLQAGTQPMEPLYVDSAGILKSFTSASPLPVSPCALGLMGYPYWKPTGNTFAYPQCDPNVIPVFGTRSHHPISFIADNVERMYLSKEGKLGIGTRPPTGGGSTYRLYVEDGIATRDVQVKLGTWPDYVFEESHELMPFNDLRTFLRTQHHLPGIPSSAELEAQGGVELGDMQRRVLQVVEEQALYILQLQAHLAELEQRLKALEQSK